MNCKQAKIAIALWAGDDLPERDINRLRRHLQNCPVCAAELESFRQSYGRVNDIFQADQPQELPSNFAHLVLDKIDRAATFTRTASSRRIRRPLYITAAVTAVTAVILFLITQNPILVRQAQLKNHLRTIAEMESYHPEIRWDAKLKYLENLEGPIALDQWNPTEKPGIVAVMHRPDPVNKPTTYVLDYCRDSRNIKQLKSYPWFDQRINHLALQAGSRDNIFVAFYYLPNSTRIERNQIIKKLEKKYKANLFERKGI